MKIIQVKLVNNTVKYNQDPRVVNRITYYKNRDILGNENLVNQLIRKTFL